MIELTNQADLAADAELVSTSGAIALANLHAQIDGLEAQLVTGRLSVVAQAGLLDLLLLRGHILGRIADYERASALAEQLVHNAPCDGIAWLARARARAALHRFAAALADLDTAERCDADQAALASERAAIFQALGRYEEALAFRRSAAERRPSFATLGALAGLQAERGWLADAERLFAEARWRYREVSPFPLAMLDFQRGLMWLEQGDLSAARVWFEAARYRAPAYAVAVGHLAEVDMAQDSCGAALVRLRLLVASSDDPEYAGLLACVLSQAGQVQEASHWRAKAAAGYDTLMLRHAAAFADHAAEFWLGAGADAHKGLELARRNLQTRQTPRAYALLRRAELASAGH
jgi:tetratricopeptide (TPR) repeat protein